MKPSSRNGWDLSLAVGAGVIVALAAWAVGGIALLIWTLTKGK